MKKNKLPRIMLAAMHSGAGKTTITCGLLSAFRKRDIPLRSFKCGPDYIDPMFHREVLGIPSGNLDSYFTKPARLRRILCQNPAELTVLEGVMGYYDGLGGISSDASSYEIAKLTDTPVVLIADARGVSVSLCAEIQGMQNYGDRCGSQIAGVILNRVSPMFYPRLKTLVEEKCGIPVLGYLPEDPALRLPSRHLGLVKPEELPDFQHWTEVLRASVEEHIELDRILAIAKAAGDPGETEELPAEKGGMEEAKEQPMKKVKLAVAEDAAFQFEYSENRVLLERLGAELVPFSPLSDAGLPENADGLIFSGGYPENHAQALSDNVVMREAVCRAVKRGMPTIAECGGFLYLSAALDQHEMCGLFPGHAEKQKRLTRFGYLEACFPSGGVFGPAGTCLRGHEFHYYDTEANGEDAEITKPRSDRRYRTAYYSESLYAGFPHFYLESNPAAAEAFVAACRRFHDAREAKRHWDQIAKPIDSLGKLEDAVVRLSALQGNVFEPDFSKRGLLIFAADHGVLAEGVSQTDATVSRIVAEELAGGRGVTSRLAKRVGADVFVADVGLLPDKTKAEEDYCDAAANTDDMDEYSGIVLPPETCEMQQCLRTGVLLPLTVRYGSRNLAEESAMTLPETEKAIRIGRAMVRILKQSGYTILGTGEMGIGNTTAATAVFLGLLLQQCIPAHWNECVQDTVYRDATETDLQDENRYLPCLDKLLLHFVGRGAGLSDAGLERKRAAIRRGLLRVRARNVADPLAVLSELGGYEIAAMTGAFLGAAEENLPILVDGAISAAAALAAACLDRRVRNVLIASHQPREAVGRTSLQLLALSPILDGDFALGEGSGTMLLLPLLDMALDIYREMGSFQDIKVPQYERFV